MYIYTLMCLWLCVHIKSPNRHVKRHKRHELHCEHRNFLSSCLAGESVVLYGRALQADGSWLLHYYQPDPNWAMLTRIRQYVAKLPASTTYTSANT